MTVYDAWKTSGPEYEPTEAEEAQWEAYLEQVEEEDYITSLLATEPADDEAGLKVAA